MKKLVIALTLVLCMTLVVPMPVMSDSPWVPPDYEPGTPLDYNEDGIIDCYYVMRSGETSDGINYIHVVYRTVQPYKKKYIVNMLGQEFWFEGYGVVYDSYEPYTYPFPP